MTNSSVNFKKYIQSSIDVKLKILNNPFLVDTLEKICLTCLETYKLSGKVILAGNGGSAADAQHIAAEFVSRFNFDRPGLSALSLSSDPSIVTAIGNDYGYENLFSRQIEANSKPGDVFIGITTSGKSKNIINATKKCKALSVKSIILTGEFNSELIDVSDIVFSVPSDSTPLIQEAHIMLGHMICAYVENSLFG